MAASNVREGSRRAWDTDPEVDGTGGSSTLRSSCGSCILAPNPHARDAPCPPPWSRRSRTTGSGAGNAPRHQIVQQFGRYRGVLGNALAYSAKRYCLPCGSTLSATIRVALIELDAVDVDIRSPVRLPPFHSVLSCASLASMNSRLTAERRDSPPTPPSRVLSRVVTGIATWAPTTPPRRRSRTLDGFR